MPSADPPVPVAAGRRLGLRLAALLLTAPLPLVGLALPSSAQAQPLIPKIESMCPLGYVDLFNGFCSTLGEPSPNLARRGSDGCPSGWTNVGGGYCRRK
jgi:hypothetical protein